MTKNANMTKTTKTEHKNVAREFLAAADIRVATKSITGRSGDPEAFAKEVLKHVEVLLANLATDPNVREYIKVATKTLKKRTRQDVQEFTAYMQSVGAW